MSSHSHIPTSREMKLVNCKTCKREFMTNWKKDCPECREMKRNKNMEEIHKRQKKKSKRKDIKRHVIIVKMRSEAWKFRGDIMCQECSKSLPTGSRGAYRGSYKDSED